MAERDTEAQLANVRQWLIDTGPLVAYLDPRDAEHELVVSHLDDFSGQLATTAAVVTEAMHLITTSPEGPELLAEFVDASRIRVHDYTQPRHLRQAAALMRKYADTPMDFADATLVLLAGDLNVIDIATLDRRGFTVYRTARGKSFRQVLES